MSSTVQQQKPPFICLCSTRVSAACQARAQPGPELGEEWEQQCLETGLASANPHCCTRHLDLPFHQHFSRSKADSSFVQSSFASGTAPCSIGVEIEILLRRAYLGSADALAPVNLRWALRVPCCLLECVLWQGQGHRRSFSGQVAVGLFLFISTGGTINTFMAGGISKVTTSRFLATSMQAWAKFCPHGCHGTRTAAQLHA